MQLNFFGESDLQIVKKPKPIDLCSEFKSLKIELDKIIKTRVESTDEVFEKIKDITSDRIEIIRDRLCEISETLLGDFDLVIDIKQGFKLLKFDEKYPWYKELINRGSDE